MDTTSFPPGRTDPSDQVSTKPGALQTLGRPELVFGVAPWEAGARLSREDTSLLTASERLQDAGYERHGGRWERAYDDDTFLDSDDVPARLLALLDHEVSVIVPTGVLDQDVKDTLERRRGGPPRLKAMPVYDE
jgi:hypothetical protein